MTKSSVNRTLNSVFKADLLCLLIRQLPRLVRGHLGKRTSLIRDGFAEGGVGKPATVSGNKNAKGGKCKVQHSNL